MKRRIKYYCLALFAVLMLLQGTQVKIAKAEVHVSGFWKYLANPETKTAELLGYTGWDTELTIPSKIDGYKVDRLNGTFMGNTVIVSVNIPDSIVDINSFTFNNCTKLSSVSIGKGVTELGSVFKGCTNLKTVKLGLNIKKISGSFNNCTSLETVTIPASVEIIDEPFNNCSSLKSVKFADNSKLKSISSSMFRNCKALESVTLPDTVTELGMLAFENCEKLATVNLSKNLKTVGPSCFRNCISLTNLELPNGLETIGGEAFYRCSSLESIDIPDTVTSLGDQSTFEDCRNLVSVKISGSVEYLPERVFSNCSSLKKVTLMDGLLAIRKGVFFNCTSLKELVIPNTVVTIASDTGRFRGITFYEVTDVKLTIPNSVTEIGNQMFTNYSYFGKDKNPMNVTIYGYKDSVAENYAKKYGLNFIELEAIPATKIEISAAKNTIGVGEVLSIKYDIKPADTTDAVVWKSSAEKVAKVNGLGKVTGMGVGSAVIRAETTSGENMDFIVTVGEAPSYVTIKNSTVTLGVGETFTQKGTVNDAAVTKTLTYTSSDPSIATVTSSGKVTAEKTGTVEITLTTYNGKTASYTITVKKAPSSVKLTASSNVLKINKKLQIKTTLSSNSSSNKLTYTTSNKSIATISSEGVVTAKKAGKVTITATTYNGKKATYTINVIK